MKGQRARAIVPGRGAARVSRNRLVGDEPIRQALKARLRQAAPRDRDVAILDELGVLRGQVRIDLALIDQHIEGFEIKSDLDTLRRLERQTELFGSVFERMTLVTVQRHLEAAMSVVPDWWGVWVVRSIGGDMQFECRRSTFPNPDLQFRALVELLWLNESLRLLASKNAVRGFRSKPRADVWDRVCEVCEPSEIALAVRTHLKARVASRAGSPSP